MYIKFENALTATILKAGLPSQRVAKGWILPFTLDAHLSPVRLDGVPTPLSIVF